MSNNHEYTFNDNWGSEYTYKRWHAGIHACIDPGNIRLRQEDAANWKGFIASGEKQLMYEIEGRTRVNRIPSYRVLSRSWRGIEVGISDRPGLYSMQLRIPVRHFEYIANDLAAMLSDPERCEQEKINMQVWQDWLSEDKDDDTIISPEMKRHVFGDSLTQLE